MSKKRGNWATRIFILVGAIGFLSFAVVPVVTGIIETQQAADRGATVAAQPTEQDNRADLEAQERGYELVLQREPENETAMLGLLQVRMQLNDIPGTVEPLEKLAELHPDESRYAVLLAQVKRQAGDSEGAAQTYRSLLTTEPGNVDALQGLVDLLLDEGRPEAAIGLLEDTLKSAPQANRVESNSVDVTSVRLLLGSVYASENRFSEALTVYDNTIKDDDKDFRPLLAKAIVLQQQGNLEEAKPLFEKALTLAPAESKDAIQARIEQIDLPNSAVPLEEEVGEDSTNLDTDLENPNLESPNLESLEEEEAPALEDAPAVE
ncbi:MAG: tetratricopeptide repeat protein [Cyanobacteriota bacterium]|nr:tetratricopeptide repeat protein [Cyanobacteriota bacterium]